jgi:hypothetical protein
MDTAAMLAASLMSAGVGFVCGLIVGRDTRSTVTLHRRQESQALTIADEWTGPPLPRLHWPGNGTAPEALPQPVPWGSARGSSPQWMSIDQLRPPDNAPLYAGVIEGLSGYYYCSDAVEIGNGMLRMSRTVCGEVHQWTYSPGEWIRCR